MISLNIENVKNITLNIQVMPFCERFDKFRWKDNSFLSFDDIFVC